MVEIIFKNIEKRGCPLMVSLYHRVMVDGQMEESMPATMDWTRYEMDKARDCIERAQRAVHHKPKGYEREATVEMKRAHKFLQNALKQTKPV